MSVTDRAPFLKDIDVGFFQKYKDAHIPTTHSPTAVKYVEPHVRLQAHLSKRTTAPDESESIEEPSYESGKIESKIIVLEDFIDTDAVIAFPLKFHTKVRLTRLGLLPMSSSP
jgi:hypothetical protein